MEAKEAKEAKMGSQMELRWKQKKQRKPRLTPKIETKESQDRIQVTPSNPRENTRNIKKTGHNWSVFKIYRELNEIIQLQLQMRKCPLHSCST